MRRYLVLFLLVFGGVSLSGCSTNLESSSSTLRTPSSEVVNKWEGCKTIWENPITFERNGETYDAYWVLCQQGKHPPYQEPPLSYGCIELGCQVNKAGEEQL